MIFLGEELRDFAITSGFFYNNYDKPIKRKKMNKYKQSPCCSFWHLNGKNFYIEAHFDTTETGVLKCKFQLNTKKEEESFGFEVSYHNKAIQEAYAYARQVITCFASSIS